MSSGSSRSHRRRGASVITPFDDPNVDAEFIVWQPDGSQSTQLLYRNQHSATAASTTSRASQRPSTPISSSGQWQEEAAGFHVADYEADPRSHLRDPNRTPAVAASDGRITYVIEDAGCQQFYFAELVPVRACDGSEGLASQCSCSREGMLAGALLGPGSVVALQSISDLAGLIQPCQHCVELAAALELGELLQPNAAGYCTLQQLAAAAQLRLGNSLDEDGAVIVPLPDGLAGGSAAAVRCPGEASNDWAVVADAFEGTKPPRCQACKPKLCRHTLLLAGSEQQSAKTMQQHRFDAELESFLSSDRQQRQVVGLSQTGPIPQLSPSGEMTSPHHAAVIAARCVGPLPSRLQPDDSPCSCGGCDWHHELASAAAGQGVSRLYDVTRCAEVEVISLRCNTCGEIRAYDGFQDCIINMDNKALFTWEIVIRYLNEYSTGKGRTFFTYWRNCLASFVLSGSLEAHTALSLLSSGWLRTKFQDAALDFITLQLPALPAARTRCPLPPKLACLDCLLSERECIDYKTAMACCDGEHCSADGIALGYSLSHACLTDLFWRASDDAPAVAGSRFADRVPIPCQATRKQLQQFAAPPRGGPAGPQGLTADALEGMREALCALGMECIAQLCSPVDPTVAMQQPQPALREFLFALGAGASTCQLAPAASWPALRQLVATCSLAQCCAELHRELLYSSPVLYRMLSAVQQSGRIPQHLASVLSLLVERAEAAYVPTAACSGCSSCLPNQPAAAVEHTVGRETANSSHQQQYSLRSRNVPRASSTDPSPAADESAVGSAAQPARGTAGDEASGPCISDEEAFLRSGHWFGAHHSVKRRLHRYIADSAQHQQRQEFCTKHAYNTKKFVPGTFLIWCLKHRKCLGFFVLHQSESPRALFEALYTRWGKAPIVVIYDNGCNLSHFCLNREPEFFHDTTMLVDAAHFNAGHASCSPAFYSRNYPHLTDNSQVQEQKNSQLDFIRDQARHFSQCNYLFMVRYYLYRLNQRQENTTNNGNSIV